MTREVAVKWVEGLKFMGIGYTNHAIVIDGPADSGGNDSAVRPGEMVLMALAACTGIDVVSLLKKMRVAFDSFDIAITAETAEEHPKYFKKINVRSARNCGRARKCTTLTKFCRQKPRLFRRNKR